MAVDVLLIGSGGREHALAWKLKQSSRIGKLYVVPGNGGTRLVGENVPIGAMEFEKLAQFAEEKKIGLTVCSVDNPLAAGIVDFFQSRGLRIWGPTKAAAQIESSKAFAKQLMREEGIPTGSFWTFRDYGRALEYAAECAFPIVVKASGLAQGKGVHICRTFEEAEQALALLMLEGVKKGGSGEVVIEEFLEGEEVSIHALCDGNTAVLWPPSRDRKQVGDGNKGKNTGGMGVIAPVSWVSAEMMAEIEQQVVHPALAALARNRTPFTGALYPGLMWTSTGWKVLEYNARLGDPETQAYMRLLKTDLLNILEACVEVRLSQLPLIEWRPGFAVCVVIASGGYPDKYRTRIPIYGVEEAEKIPQVVVFHAGTAYENGQLVTDGGRVLNVNAVGATLKEALDRAYQAAKLISFEGMHYRLDIGKQALSRELRS